MAVVKKTPLQQAVYDSLQNAAGFGGEYLEWAYKEIVKLCNSAQQAFVENGIAKNLRAAGLAGSDLLESLPKIAEQDSANQEAFAKNEVAKKLADKGLRDYYLGKVCVAIARCAPAEQGSLFSNIVENIDALGADKINNGEVDIKEIISAAKQGKIALLLSRKSFSSRVAKSDYHSFGRGA